MHQEPELGWTSDEHDGFYVFLSTTDDPDTVHGAPKAKAIILDKRVQGNFMKNYLGVYFVVPGSLGVPQPAWAQSWSVAQSKSRKVSLQCRIDSWSADVTITQYSWKVHKAQHASSRKSLAVGKVLAEFGRRGKLFAIITIIAGTASRNKQSSRN